MRETLEQKRPDEDPAGSAPAVPTPVRSLDPPVPVRSVAPPPEARPEAPSDVRHDPTAGAVPPGAEVPPPVESPRATFQLGEQDWVARVEGYGQSGSAGDRGAPLLALSFARGAEPERPLFETLCQGRALEDLSEARLVELLAGARPYVDPGERAEIFSQTRVRKKEL